MGGRRDFGHKPDPANECVLAKVTQYQCRKGEYIKCRPIQRLFKRCPGMPSVELISDGTRFIDVRTHKDVPIWSGMPTAEAP
ncbi:hypothetical protein GGF46_003058 [Coemansia sp. RSA 552]|nr:hypothetical protein GGF46_003058 [Coemansia sp. RSA 552]